MHIILYFRMKVQSRSVGRLEGLFTRQERKALAFLLGMGFFGLAAQAWQVGRRPASPAAWEVSQVRVNRAGPAELASLPGIGPVLAKRIAEDRQRGGFYLTLGDLGRVKGITPRTLGKLQGLVRFD